MHEKNVDQAQLVSSEIFAQEFSLLGIEYNADPSAVLDLLKLEPSGPIGGLGRLRVSEAPVGFPVLYDQGGDPGMLAFYEQLQEKTKRRMSELRGYFQGLLRNSDFLEYLADEKEVDFDVLQKATGMSSGYENIVSRMESVLTNTVDPEVIPMAVATATEDFTLGCELAAIFDGHSQLRKMLTRIISNPEFVKEFMASKGFDGYTSKWLEILNTFIATVCEKYTAQFPEKESDEIKEHLQHFFNMDGAFWTNDPQTCGKMMVFAKQTTTGNYFQQRAEDGSENQVWSRFSQLPESLPDYMSEYAQGYQKARYFVGVYSRANTLFKELFSQVYVDPVIKSLSVSYARPVPGRKDEFSSSSCASNGFWSDKDRTIGIRTPTSPEGLRPEAIQNEKVQAFVGGEGRRAIVDVLMLIHEIAHAVYNTRVQGSQIIDRESYADSADHAINEGHSVLLELVCIDHFIQNAADLSLTDEDVVFLEDQKVARLYFFKNTKSAYTEGTFRILHKVFVAGAGKGTERNVAAGLEAVAQFLDEIDSMKTLALRRDSPEYLEALQSGDPEQWFQLFS